MPSIRKLIGEIHRRSLWQVLGIYLVGSWVAYQVVLSLVEGLGLPHWVPPMAVVLFVIGLPIVVATAIVQEGLPDAGETAALAAASERTGTAEESTGLGRLFTWRGAISGGVLAFALLGVAVAGFTAMRSLGVGPMGSLVGKGELQAQDYVLVATFNALTGDSAIAAVVAEAVRVDLTQSALLNVVDRTRIQHALDRMGRDRATRLSPDLAREVAYRLGVKAVVEGEVGGAAGSYLISARLVTPDSGRVLASFRETAEDSTELLPAVDRLTRALREKAGESLRSIRSNPPLAQVTTPSLPALRKYVRAKERAEAGERGQSITLLEEALALDPQFASAHRALATHMWNRGERGDSLYYHLEQAVQLEGRLTDYERHHARGFRGVVLRDLPAARRSYEAVLALDSTDYTALINLGVVYGMLNEDEQALELNRRAYGLGVRAPVVYWNLVQNHLNLGHLDEAERVARLDAEEGGREERSLYMQWLVAMARHDFADADSLTRVLGREPGEERRAESLRTTTDLLRGRLDRYHDIQDWLELRGDAVGRLHSSIPLGYTDLFIRQDPTRAAERAVAAVSDPALDSVPTADLPLPGLALVLALAGRTDTALSVIRTFRSNVRPELLPQHESLLGLAEGVARITAGDVERGLRTVQRARWQSECNACADPILGYAFEATARQDSAIVAYERYLDTPWSDRHDFSPIRPPNDLFLRVHVHERLAALYLDAGKPTEARRHLAAIIELWQDVDPELQPRVTEVRQRLERLTAEG